MTADPDYPQPARLVAALPATIPFVAPEAIERMTGKRFDLRLGANESAFGISPHAKIAMAGAVQEISWYADPESHELRLALAAHHGIGLGNIVVGSGIDGLLGLAVRAYCNPGDPVVTSRGTYPTFNYHVAGFDGRLHRVPYRADHQDLQGLIDAARAQKARMVYIANPDNPSGTWHSGAAIAALIAALPTDCLLVLDEAYAEFAPADGIMPLDASDPRVVRLRTFSKAHGMAGARIGYAVGTESIIGEFNKIRSQFEVNRVAQAGALASLRDHEFAASVVRAVADGRRALEALAGEMNLPTIRSTTNFVCFDLGGAEKARATVAALAAHGVFVRMPGEPPLNRCIRVTVGTPGELAEFAGVFRKVWNAIRGAEENPVALARSQTEE